MEKRVALKVAGCVASKCWPSSRRGRCALRSKTCRAWASCIAQPAQRASPSHAALYNNLLRNVAAFFAVAEARRGVCAQGHGCVTTDTCM